jgi:Photoprotection regulator fluorescence recovery protein
LPPWQELLLNDNGLKTCSRPWLGIEFGEEIAIMPSIQPPAKDVYSTMRDLHWSGKEKDIARRAFDRALRRELEATIREAKQMAEKIKEASELWELEQHLTKRRKEIDAKYEYKYSVRLVVLADLVREDRISLDELDGPAEDKLRCIRDHATSAT